MRMPEQTGGAHILEATNGGMVDVLSPEFRLDPDVVARHVSMLVVDARRTYMQQQAQRSPDLQVPVALDSWILLYEVDCEMLGLSHAEAWETASEYDEGVLAEDQLGMEERNYFGSIRDHYAHHLATHLGDRRMAPHADIFARGVLREELAARAIRLTYLSRLSPDAYARRNKDYQLLALGRLASLITEQAWNNLVISPASKLPAAA